ncbi:ankyrin repeat domain-containing protein [Halovulum sp. GXIMD14793]
MAKANRNTLPKNFEDLLVENDLETLKDVFETCCLDARGGTTKQTALAFSECPDELARWLVDQGADISAADRYGETPLHARALHWQGRLEVLLELGADVHLRDTRGNTPLHGAAAAYNAKTVNVLLKHGARADAVNHDKQTPLSHALRRCSNANIVGMAEIAEILLAASRVPEKTGFLSKLFGSGKGDGSVVTQDMKHSVLRIGANFEFHRSGFNPDYVDATSAALDRLYLLFDVPPVPRRAMHDGKSPIVAKAARWEERHQELWELLVPSSGAAETVQGEVVRVSGKIRDEFERNGGANWDADYKKLADAFLAYTGSGVPLSKDECDEASVIVKELNRRGGDTARMCELAVNWVALNPKPLELPPPKYHR